MSHNDTQHIKIQVGDTSRPWRFRLRSEGDEYAIPTGFSFTLYMVADDADEGDDPKINAATCTFTDNDDSVYFQPEASDVDTAGRYHGQLWGLTDTARPMRPIVFAVTIRANVA